MKRLALSLIVLIGLLAGQASAQEAIVKAVRQPYPTPLGARHAAFLIEVACATNKGLLRKDWGTFVRLPDGTGVSQDIVMDRTGLHWDILGDGEGVASPHWDLVQEPPAVDPARYYAPTCAAPPADPPPVVTPPPPVVTPDPGVDVIELLRQLLEALAAAENHLRSELAAVRSELAEIKARPLPAFPDYQGSVNVLGRPVTFTLRPKTP